MGKYKSLISSVKTVLLNEEKPVNLDEGRMGEFHALIKRGTPAEQIAKVMKLDLKTIKALMPKSGRPAGRPVDEELTPAQSKKKEEIVLSMKKKKKEFQDRYGDEWESVMHATATKMSKESIELGELRRAKYPKGDPKAGEYADPRTHKDTFYVKWAKAKRDKITVEPFKTLAKAKARLADVRKKGFNGIISQGGKPEKESVELDELRRDVYVITDKKGKVVAAKLTKDNAHKEISRHRGGTIVLDPDANVGAVLKKFARKKSVTLDEAWDAESVQRTAKTGYGINMKGGKFSGKKPPKTPFDYMKISPSKGKNFNVQFGLGKKKETFTGTAEEVAAKINDLFGFKESIEMEENYDKMMKWYETSNEKKVYAILKKNNIKLLSLIHI